jgi:hypothetical protein
MAPSVNNLEKQLADANHIIREKNKLVLALKKQNEALHV